MPLASMYANIVQPAPHFLGLAKKLDMLRIVDASFAMEIRLASSFASFARFLASSFGSKRALFCPGFGRLS